MNIRQPRGGHFTQEELALARKRRRDGRYAHTGTEVARLLGRKYSQILKVRSGVDL